MEHLKPTETKGELLQELRAYEAQHRWYMDKANEVEVKINNVLDRLNDYDQARGISTIPQPTVFTREQAAQINTEARRAIK